MGNVPMTPEEALELMRLVEIMGARVHRLRLGLLMWTWMGHNDS